MATKTYRYIGRGVYTLADAGRLTKVPTRNLRRWSQGYTYRYRGQVRHSPPIIGTGMKSRSKEPIFVFRDIMEIRFLSAFRRHGVSWQVIRYVASRVRDHLEVSHPFASRVFRTDGRTILLELKDELDHRLIDLVRDQYEWERVIHRHLVEERVEFDEFGEAPVRWWPLGRERQVVVDPLRSFGAPIVSREGVQTYVLAKAVGVEGDVDYVARWYDVDPLAIRDAIDFESGIRAAS